MPNIPPTSPYSMFHFFLPGPQTQVKKPLLPVPAHMSTQMKPSSPMRSPVRSQPRARLRARGPRRGRPPRYDLTWAWGRRREDGPHPDRPSLRSNRPTGGDRRASQRTPTRSPTQVSYLMIALGEKVFCER